MLGSRKFCKKTSLCFSCIKRCSIPKKNMEKDDYSPKIARNTIKAINSPHRLHQQSANQRLYCDFALLRQPVLQNLASQASRTFCQPRNKTKVFVQYNTYGYCTQQSFFHNYNNNDESARVILHHLACPGLLSTHSHHQSDHSRCLRPNLQPRSRFQPRSLQQHLFHLPSRLLPMRLLQHPFVLSHMACLIDNNIHTYKVYRYLNQLNLASMAADISNFYFADTGVALNVTKVIEVCRANLYESFAAGLFKITEVISLGYLYENKIDRISIKFNFMAVISSVTLVVDINGESYYVNEFDIFSDLSGRYGIDSNTSAPGYLFLDALSGSTADSIFYEVDTGLMSIMAQKVEIQIYIKSAAPVNTYSWGFNDVVVVTRACETCVSQAVSDLIDKVVLLIWIVTIMVAALILLLFTFIKIQAIKRRLDFQEKLGSTASNHNLPLKALDRLSESLKRSVTTMQKEFKKQDRRFMKLMKRQ